MRAAARTWIRTAALARMPERPVPGRPIGQLEVSAVQILARSFYRWGTASGLKIYAIAAQLGPVAGDRRRAARGDERRLRTHEPAPRAERPPHRGTAHHHRQRDDRVVEV